VVYETAQPSAAMIQRIPLSSFFDSLAVNLDPQKSHDVDQKVLMEFPDVEAIFTIHVRHGVAEIRERPLDAINKGDFHIHVVAHASKWKEMLAKIRNPLTTLAGFRYQKGNTLAFTRFISLFKPADQKLPLELLD